VGPKDKFRAPVAILTSNVTASSGEATLLSFRGLENTRTFGQPSAGYASGNLIIDMPDGAGLMVTTANDVARTGEEFSEDPIAPDVSTDRPEQAATEWLHSQCGQ
jgi:peptidase, S41 family